MPSPAELPKVAERQVPYSSPRPYSVVGVRALSARLSDLTRQWALQDGALNFDCKWLSEKYSPAFYKESVGRTFEELFGGKIDDARVV